ncbi:MAG: hypothetical protein K5695_00280 [Oscillospiraceae bacterium]|nr:hypothetical protein [Oscillospiraceae bacterium]
MHVLNLHGYRGWQHNFAYEALIANGCQVISPAIDYDSTSPETILDDLRRIARQEQFGLVVGTSLGGFFAAALSAELCIPVILVNPYLMPFLSDAEHAKAYTAIFGRLSMLDRDNVSCIAGEADAGDDSFALLRNLARNERFCIVQGGQHSGGTLPLKTYFGEMLGYYGFAEPNDCLHL